MLRRALFASVSAMAIAGFTYSAQASPALPNLENLNFLDYTGAAPKTSFTNNQPVGWTGGSGLIYIVAPGTDPTSLVTACGPTYLQTYGCPTTLAIPGGYNEVEADGNPDYESGFNYSVHGLTPGQTYTLSFYQAASQQTGFTGNTTEQWIVSLGKSGLVVTDSGVPGFKSYSNPDAGATTVATTLMHTPSGGMVDWNYVSIDLTADSTTNLLSFLAWGNNGSTVNEPPMVFLAGVNSSGGLVPEPAALTLFGVGLVGLGMVARRRRVKA